LLRLRLALLRFRLSFLLFVIGFRVLGWRWWRHTHDPVELPLPWQLLQSVPDPTFGSISSWKT
jgi:hypothetical protein